MQPLNQDEALRRAAKNYLTTDELFSLKKIIGREPNTMELNMFAAMWSEHVSYKSSVKWIEELPFEGEGVLVGAMDENAGIIDLGNGYACVVKMESHNHPTAVNPGQGAVGVGNVLRDIMAMGAKPVAHLNILRFGDLQEPENRELVKGVIRSLGRYSNHFGVPVVGGEVLFHSSYHANPLVNLMAVGVVRKDRIIKAAFTEPGSQVFLLGKETSGRGVHGAGFASMPFSRKIQQMIPEAQMADPRAGKVLLDSLLEMNEKGVIHSMQDVGAGGVLCAACEMAFRGKLGVELYVRDFPVIRDDLSPLELLLSQSQEQMLVVVPDENIPKLKEITNKWEITYARVGRVIPDDHIRIYQDEEKLADLPVSSLVRGGGAPVYIRHIARPKRKVIRVTADEVPLPGDLKEVARALIRQPNIASRRWIYEQFDTMAGLSSVSGDHSSDAGIVQLPGQEPLLAVSVDGNSRYIKMEPRQGAMIAVAEAARNIVCSGGTPLAVANGLNFGDPSDPSVYYDFTESIKGIRGACNRMSIPVIAGNVSFNNMTRQGEEVFSVQPTPVIGMVGVLREKEERMTVSFQDKGDMIFLLGRSDNDLSASEYLASYHLIDETAPPELNLEFELRIQEIVAMLIRRHLIASAHDVSMGGLFVTLVECCLRNGLGFDVTSPAEVRTDAFLFGESPSRVVVSVSPRNETEFLDLMIEQKVSFSTLGHVTKEELRIDDSSFGFIADYAQRYEQALSELLS